MSDIAIRVEELSKQYRLGTVGTGTLSHDLNRWWARLRGKEDPFARVGEVNDRATKGDSKYVWALKDINFEVKQGEVLGIIGKNGAGKSTLLKILSKVTAPTQGRIKVNGRIASLLEVGTGFHQELTGRENIFLNGAILGMTKAEIKSKLDEIVEFAGVARYLDTPVKRYSSGMTVRLAFAVAAHLEPEILVVDEVLAVGDAEFQKKAIGKIKEVSEGGGRTVLFVSHNMMSIRKLCSSGILLKDGLCKFQSNNIREVIRKYSVSDAIYNEQWINTKNCFSNEYFELNSFRFCDAISETINQPVENNDEVWVEICMHMRKYDPALEIGYNVVAENGQTLFWSYFYDVDCSDWERLKEGYVVLKSKLPTRFFNNGSFRFNLVAGLRKRVWFINPNTDNVTIEIKIDGNLSDSPLWNIKRSGPVAPLLKWEIERKVLSQI